MEPKKPGPETSILPPLDNSESSNSYFSHKKHFFIITAAGKPVFTRYFLYLSLCRYSNDKSIAALCATFAAIVPKLQNLYYDQNACTTRNTLRYIKTKNMITVFVFKRNLAYICVSKGKYSLTFLKSQLEFLHVQLVSMITNNLNLKLTANPSLDIKVYLDGICNVVNKRLETDESIPTAIKFSSHAPYCFMNGFPVFRVPSKLRHKLTNIMLGHKPKGILMGMLLVSNAFVTIIREQNIVINPLDMNVILTTIQSHPAVKKAATSLPLCLPGVSDEGYLYLTIKYVTPFIGIVYASLSHEEFFVCLEQANKVTEALEKEKLSDELTKYLNEFYIERKPLVPNVIEIGRDITLAIVKDCINSQIATLGMPIMTTNKEEKHALIVLEEAYQKFLYPREPLVNLEYMERNEKEVVYVESDDKITMVILARSTLSDEDVATAKEKIKKMVGYDPDQFFIGNYK